MINKRVINTARQHMERKYNYTHYINGNWCMANVNKVLQESGSSLDFGASCTRARDIAIKNRLWYVDHNTASVGDILFYDWDLSGDCDHVGIISAIDGRFIHVIEGNIHNDNYKLSEIGIRTIEKNYNKIAGFIRTANIPLRGATSNLCTPKCIELEKGCSGILVKTLQTFLILQNFTCGSCGADGDFGNDTEKAVRSYQYMNKLDVDGVVGCNTWTSILTEVN